MTQAIDASAEYFNLKQFVIEQISHVLAAYPEIERGRHLWLKSAAGVVRIAQAWGWIAR